MSGPPATTFSGRLYEEAQQSSLRPWIALTPSSEPGPLLDQSVDMVLQDWNIVKDLLDELLV